MKISFAVAFLSTAVLSLAAPQPWNGGGSPPPSSPPPSSGSGTGTCSQNEHPVCCNGALNCVVQALTESCSGSTYCCQSNDNGLLNLLQCTQINIL